MKGKGERKEEKELTRDQCISNLRDLAMKAKASIINKDFDSDIHQLADELKKFSQVTLELGHKCRNKSIWISLS